MITRFAPSSLILLSCDIHATRTLRYNRLFESGDALPNKNYAHKKINPEIKTRRTSYGKRKTHIMTIMSKCSIMETENNKMGCICT